MLDRLGDLHETLATALRLIVAGALIAVTCAAILAAGFAVFWFVRELRLLRKKQESSRRD